MKGVRRRREHIRAASKTLVIVCEGQKSERYYFKDLRQTKRRCDIKIELPDCTHTDPIGLIEYASDMIRRYGLNFSGGDMVYCVFDCDGSDKKKREAIEHAFSVAKEKRICIGFSNPSFELRYILHFEPRPPPMSQDEAEMRLREKFIKDYRKNVSYYDDVKENTSFAVNNARGLRDKYCEDGICAEDINQCNPFTTLHELIEYILTQS